MERDVPPPKYLEAQPRKDLSRLFETEGPIRPDVSNIDILKDWPQDLLSRLDKSQMDALRRIIGKRLAIIQGPPGTGKTFVSVSAIRLMIENMSSGDPPILVAAHTNHALDQLLRHVSVFEPDFVRLGGWTKDEDIVRPRTLYELKQAVRNSNPKGCLRGPAVAKIRHLAKEMTLLLAPLIEGSDTISASLLNQDRIITDAQYESLVTGAREWIRTGAESTGDLALWLGDERVEARHRTMPEDFGIEIEEVDLEFEQLREMEAESKMVDDEDHDTLRGSRVVFNELYTGNKGFGVTEQMVQIELSKRDMWSIPSEHRGPVYRYIQRQFKDRLKDKFRTLAFQYCKASQEAKIGTWEIDYNYLKESRVIGMTTTGLSKYRGLFQSLQPKVVLIEEAAETLEAPIAVGCFQSLEHLVLVGDHQQLRAHCNDDELAGKPWYLGVSLFERLIRNKVEFAQLNVQRRMIPEIRRCLQPIYDTLSDHSDVMNRAPVPGMGGTNSYFFTHKWRETTDSQMSKTNVEEADLIVGFFNYLVQNSLKPSDITVLTFYNGQRKLILRKLRERRQSQEDFFKVVTVDSYQGEENQVVLLSLVRSNVHANIGFLRVENRVCVALSRAQRGFFIFGDGPNLCKSSLLWWHVIQTMGTPGKVPCRLGFHLPLVCEQHGNKTFIKGT